MSFRKSVWLSLVFIALMTVTVNSIKAEQITMNQADQKQFNIMTSAGTWILKNSGLCAITRMGFLIKSVLEKLVDNVFDMLCKSLMKLWNFTSSDSQTGVGGTASTYVNGTVMPILYTIAGAFLYLFVVLKLFTGLFMNENPSKMIGYFVLVVFLIVTFTLFYSITIELFSRVLAYMQPNTATIPVSTLSQNFASGLINNADLVTKIAAPNLTDDQIVEFYTTGKAADLWLVIIAEIITTIMFVYFAVQLLLLKGQQLVQLFLSYFLGILILPITILSGVDLFVRWIKSFIGTCLYSVSWALLIMLLFIISNISLGGLQTANSALLPSILKLMMFYGAFMLMTQVGKISEFFTGGDNFGKIAQSGSREFGSVMRMAGMAAALPVAVGAGMAGVGGVFGAGAIHGMVSPKTNTKTPSTGAPESSGSAYNRTRTGIRMVDNIAAGMRMASGITSSIYGAGRSSGSTVNELGGKSLAAIKNAFKSGGPNDGSAPPQPTSL